MFPVKDKDIEDPYAQNQDAQSLGQALQAARIRRLEAPQRQFDPPVGWQINQKKAVLQQK